MTRMWLGVEPAELCDQHLLGEHKELHQLVGSINAGIRLGKLEDFVETAEINDRHAAIVAEMERRDMNHQSPIVYADHGRNGGDVDRDKSRKDLRERCDDCRERMRTEAIA